MIANHVAWTGRLVAGELVDVVLSRGQSVAMGRSALTPCGRPADTEVMDATHRQRAERVVESTIRRIVVGVDGSDGSAAALAHAAAQARRWGAHLEVLSVWEYPWQWTEGYNVNWAEDEEWYAKRAVEQSSGLLDAVFGAGSWPDWVHLRTARGSAVTVLVEAAATADLLVVGCRGRGGFRGMLLGSVSNACVHHARCPVTVVHAG